MTRQAKINHAIAAAAAVYRVPVADIYGRHRTGNGDEARRAAIWLLHQQTELTFADIGRTLGRCRSSVRRSVGIYQKRTDQQQRLRLIERFRHHTQRDAATVEVDPAALTFPAGKADPTIIRAHVVWCRVLRAWVIEGTRACSGDSVGLLGVYGANDSHRNDAQRSANGFNRTMVRCEAGEPPSAQSPVPDPSPPPATKGAAP